MFLAVPLSRLALSLGPAEECVLVFAILTLIAHRLHGLEGHCRGPLPGGHI